MSSVVVANARSRNLTSLPSFVIESYPKFVEFLKAYYEWEATNGADLAMESMKFNNDIDFMLEELLDHHKSTYAPRLPYKLATDYRHFSKFLSEVYSLKGSEESFKILFRAMFNTEASVFYPKVRLFAASSAKWNKDVYLRVDTSYNGFDFEGMTIRGTVTGAFAEVSHVHFAEGVFFFKIDNINGQFNPTEEFVTDNSDLKGTIVPTYGVKSINSMPNWYDADIITDNGLILKVNKISYGKIEGVDIIEAGFNYEVDDLITSESTSNGGAFEAIVTAVDGSGGITSLKITRYGFGFNTDDVTLRVISNSGTQAILKPLFDQNFRKIVSLSILHNKEYTHVGDHTSTLIDGTAITYEMFATHTFPYWEWMKGTISGKTAMIQDSHYYQDFSYEIQSTTDFSDHLELLRSMLHIAGLKMFGKVIENGELNAFEGTSLTIE